MKRVLITGALLALSYPATALALPISTCGTASTVLGTHIECDLFESDSLGNPTEIGDQVALPDRVGLGAVLILEPNGNKDDQTTWSDELIFTQGGKDRFFVQLVSKGCNTGSEEDISCFRTDPDHFIFEDASGFAVDGPQSGPNANIYRVFSDVPEPATLALLGLAFGAMPFAGRRKLN